MGITAIRTALATLLEGVDGINSANPYPPNAITTSGTAWVGLDDEEIIMGPRELSEHNLLITVVVARKADLPKEVAATEPMIEAIKAVLRINQGLGAAAVDRVQYTRTRQRIYQGAGGMEFVGFEMPLSIKESRGVTLRDHP